MTAFKTGYLVSDAMTVEPIAIGKDRNIKEAAKLMAKHKVGSLLVTEGHRVVGLITDTDIVRKGVTSNVTPTRKSVQSIMSSKLITVSPDRDIFDSTRLMRDKNVKHLPVETKEGIVGLLTMKDVLKIEPDLFDILVEKFEIREAHRKPLR